MSLETQLSVAVHICSFLGDYMSWTYTAFPWDHTFMHWELPLCPVNWSERAKEMSISQLNFEKLHTSCVYWLLQKCQSLWQSWLLTWSVCIVLIKHNSTKTCGGVHVYVHTLISALDGNEWSTSCLSCCIPRETALLYSLDRWPGGPQNWSGSCG
jgi:hypothetical protein